MRDRVARLRLWLAGSGFLLIAVIVGWIAYGRFVSHLRHMKLPLPPGVNIVREAGGWTYSRANGSRTLYTIHAAGFQQGKDGKTTLHEVSVLLFGKSGDRHDRVSGHDFEYDEKQGVLRALGQVHLDLQSANAVKAIGQDGLGATVQGPEGEEKLAPDVIHVTTSGLVYLDKLGVAATSEDVDVQAGQMKGHARGADYSNDSGMLMLHSAVTLAGNSGGHPVRITAERAEFEQPTQVARLTNATYESEGRSIAAQRAVLHRGPDGTLRAVDAEGDVNLSDGAAKAIASKAQLQMNAGGQPTLAVLTGGITYTALEPLRQVRAEANKAEITFADAGAGRNPEHAVFTGAVHATERLRPEKSLDRWGLRELNAERLETWMAADAAGRTQLHRASAMGHARLVSSEPGVPGAGVSATSEISADELNARSSGTGAELALDQVTGLGHTTVSQLTKTGVLQTSTGDTLDARFAPAASGRGQSAGTLVAVQSLRTAVQEGHVAMTRRLPEHVDRASKRVPEQVQHAVADRAMYDGDTDQVTLSGAVRTNDATSAMWSRELTFDRSTGNAHASGPVKVDYAASDAARTGDGDVMHILADRADMDGASSSATFYGSPVRVWQGGNQIQAPEVIVRRDSNELVARGAIGTSGSGAVRTTLVGAPDTNGERSAAGSSSATGCRVGPTDSGAAGTGAPGGANVVRITSGGLVYVGGQHRVDFTGGVRAEAPNATIHAREATALLAGERQTQSRAIPTMDGGLKRIVASGPVDLARAGTRAFGDKLVYEAASQTFVLSGSGREPARAVDVRGKTAAAAFRFNGCDDTLEALGQAPDTERQRVDTDAVQSGAKKRENAGR